MKYQTGNYPMLRVRKDTYDRIVQIAEATGGSYADVIEKAILLLDASSSGVAKELSLLEHLKRLLKEGEVK